MKNGLIIIPPIQKIGDLKRGNPPDVVKMFGIATRRKPKEIAKIIGCSRTVEIPVAILDEDGDTLYRMAYGDEAALPKELPQNFTAMFLYQSWQVFRRMRVYDTQPLAGTIVVDLGKAA